MTDQETDQKPNPKKRGLGRGLNALFEDDEGTYLQAEPDDKTSAGQRKIVSLSQLEANPSQPRRHFDEDALTELADSIAVHGILQPLLVRPKEGFPDTFQIIAGERRWRAAQKAQLHDIPVIVREMDDSTVLQIALIENLQREDLNILEEAKGYKRLLDQFGYRQETIARIIGKSRSHIANTMRLLVLPDPVLSMLEQGSLSGGHARALINAHDPENLAKRVIAQELNVRQTEALAREEGGVRTRQKKNPSSTGAASGKDADTRALEDEVSGALGMKTVIEVKDNRGTIKIAFDNLDQLDELLHRLTHKPS